jgi:hypothetical protein
MIMAYFWFYLEYKLILWLFFFVAFKYVAISSATLLSLFSCTLRKSLCIVTLLLYHRELLLGLAVVVYQLMNKRMNEWCFMRCRSHDHSSQGHSNKTYHKQYTQINDGIPLGPCLYENKLRVIPLYFCV